MFFSCFLSAQPNQLKTLVNTILTKFFDISFNHSRKLHASLHIRLLLSFNRITINDSAYSALLVDSFHNDTVNPLSVGVKKIK
jgi:hypothetical protein